MLRIYEIKKIIRDKEYYVFNSNNEKGAFLQFHTSKISGDNFKTKISFLH